LVSVSCTIIAKKANKNLQQKFVGFHNHSPLLNYDRGFQSPVTTVLSSHLFKNNSRVDKACTVNATLSFEHPHNLLPRVPLLSAPDGGKKRDWD